MTADVELERVTIRFGDFTAVRNADLRIREGEFFSFLGPSGCGKTTILRAISGFLEPTQGAIRIGGRDMRGIGPNKRPTALIFQNLALFPLMTVAENIAFGLEVRGVAKSERRRRAESLLELIALPGQGDKRLSALSGGQMQRVAIARALAVEPAVLLLDEPLSALDLKLRQRMRSELRAIQRRVGITFIYITHDQGEALTMSDRVAVMSDGVVQQVGSGAEVYERPATPFVASFVGQNNRFPGVVSAADADYATLDTGFGPLRGRNGGRLRQGDRAILFVRPEAMTLPPAGHAAEDLNRIEAEVLSQEFEGSFVNVFLRGDAQSKILLSLTNNGSIPSFNPGETHHLAFSPERARALPVAPTADD